MRVYPLLRLPFLYFNFFLISLFSFYILHFYFHSNLFISIFVFLFQFQPSCFILYILLQFQIFCSYSSISIQNSSFQSFYSNVYVFIQFIPISTFPIFIRAHHRRANTHRQTVFRLSQRASCPSPVCHSIGSFDLFYRLVPLQQHCIIFIFIVKFTFILRKSVILKSLTNILHRVYEKIQIMLAQQHRRKNFI